MLSRVADHLYWMSRYLERAEHAARLVDVHLNLALEGSSALAKLSRQQIIAGLEAPLRADTLEDDYQLAQLLTFDRENHNSVVTCIGLARENARQVREQISSEMWSQLNQLFLTMNQATRQSSWMMQPHEFFQTIKQGSHLFQGITDSTMTHGQGWHFIQLGRFMERALATARLLSINYQGTASAGLDAHLHLLGLLKGCTAFEAYSKIYTAELQLRNVVEFLLLNHEFPHSMRFAINTLQAALDALAAATETHKGARLFRLAGKLRATLEYGQVDEIMGDGLPNYLADVQGQCIHIHNEAYQLFITYPIEDKLS